MKLSDHRRIFPAGLFEILAAVLIWGATPFVTQYAALAIPSVELTALRLLLAGFILSAFVGPKRLVQAIRKGSWLLFMLAFVGSTLPQIFYVQALATVPIPILVFVTNSYPALAIFLAVIFLREKPSSRHWIGIALAVVGLFLLAGPSFTQQRGMLVGLFFALLASLGWASSAITGKKVTAQLSAGEIAAGRHVVGGVLTLPLLLLQPPVLQGIGTGTWLAVGLLGIMLVASFYIYYKGLAQVSVATASMMESFTPVVTLLMSAVFLGQTLSGSRLVGALFVLAGTLLVSAGEIVQAQSLPQQSTGG